MIGYNAQCIIGVERLIKVDFYVMKVSQLVADDVINEQISLEL